MDEELRSAVERLQRPLFTPGPADVRVVVAALIEQDRELRRLREELRVRRGDDGSGG